MQTLTAAKARPLFLAPWEIRAILDGRKTQMRRVVDEAALKVALPRQVTSDLPSTFFPIRKADKGLHRARMNQHGAVSIILPDGKDLGVRPGEYEWVSPFGRVGDQLWVKEPFWQEHDEDWGDYGVCYYSAPNLELDSLEVQYCATPPNPEDPRPGEYLGPTCQDDGSEWPPGEDPGAWCAWEDRNKGHAHFPAICMPRRFSRLTLEVTGLRVERLRAMETGPWEAPLAEGLTVVEDHPGDILPCTYGVDGKQTNRTPWTAFQVAWDRATKDPAEKWSANPWVWVVDFRPLPA